MRTASLVASAVVGAIVISIGISVHAQQQPLEKRFGPYPVVVELFTSQGCSSCPPADELLRSIVRNPVLRGRVFPLAFHVDYWNHLGWRDPFSSAYWSRRQMFYVRAMRLQSAYTPQAVIDGTKQLVGSNAAELASTVEAESKENRPAGTLRIALARNGSNVNATIHADVAPSKSDIDVMLAIVQDEATTKVESGENGGRTLVNPAIVRRLVHAGTIRSGAFDKTVTLPLDADRIGAVVFLQEHDTLAIRGAASAHL